MLVGFDVDFSLQSGCTSAPGPFLRSIVGFTSVPPGLNCVVNIKLFRIGVDFSLQSGCTSAPGPFLRSIVGFTSVPD